VFYAGQWRTPEGAKRKRQQEKAWTERNSDKVYVSKALYDIKRKRRELEGNHD
jgi:hypothetical protein